MDSHGADREWKKNLGFPINYNSDDDDSDLKDVVMRNPKHSSKYLLEESGDGSEADLLGTTPPRARIRDKEKRRNMLDSSLGVHRATMEGKAQETNPSPTPPERVKKRSTLKLIRSKERDWKQDNHIENKADSLPSPSISASAAVPTLVESCSRFMSLTSRLKCREACEEVQERCPQEEVPSSRVTFHNTFSMLINMGNVEKGCKRTISHEEQVWQNELKDLIWLELTARMSGRTLAQQDAYLCAQREVVPEIVQRILNYKFQNTAPCRHRSRRLSVITASNDDLLGASAEENRNTDDEEQCLSLECEECSRAVGAAMRQVFQLLTAYDSAVALYPSSKAAAADHPALSSTQLIDRLRAMCLWFNTAHHMRLKILSVRRMLNTVRAKNRRALSHLSSTDSNVSRKSSVCQKPCQVRFNVSNNTSDSNSSDTSAQSDGRESDAKEQGAKDQSELATEQHSTKKSPTGEDCNDEKSINNDPEKKTECGSNEVKNGVASSDCNEVHRNETSSQNHEKAGDDVVDRGLEKQDDIKPEIVVSETYSTSDTTSTESGYNSGGEREVLGEDVFDIGPLHDVTELRLLGRINTSHYRDHHHDILKTQGVRRCFMFNHKMRKKLLDYVCLTLQEPEVVPTESSEDTDELLERKDTADEDEISPVKCYEFRRYGCWSQETLAMRLPSYRSHFLLLNSICMEAVHDYLSLRVDSTPEHASCLTIKQLIHELTEGLDIATETRVAFARDVSVALRGGRAGPRERDHLTLLLTTFDATVDTAVQQYLSYLRKMSETEALSRARLAPELAFAARLCSRVPSTMKHTDQAFADIACNQINRQIKRFEEKFEKVHEKSIEEFEEENDRYIVYALCREAQDIYMSERESTMQAAQYARVLASRLPFRSHAARLFESLMQLRSTVVIQTQRILEYSRKPMPTELHRDVRDMVTTRAREMLLQAFKLGFEVHRELHRLINETPLSVQSGHAPKTPRGLNTRSRLLRSESIGEEVEACVRRELSNDKFKHKKIQNDIASLLSGAQANQHAESTEQIKQKSEEEAEWAKRVARATIEFAKCWMTFVVERCDRGRGLRPRWASQGLEFLMLACDPCNTKHLSEEEFEELKQLMDSCISHVIGSRPLGREATGSAPSTPAAPHRLRHRLHSPLSTNSSTEGPPTTPSTESDSPKPQTVEYTAVRSKRVMEAISALDYSRDETLRELKTVGRVLESTVVSYEPKLRQLTFKWQRGLKIGAGTFGKVYTVVNTASGQVLAMKEISIAAGDRRAVQRAANELRVLEGVLHPHLVRYYGCELHREEMLLFMELCVEGSLEALVATSGALGETTTRRYTKQLLSAVQELHLRSIAHRDIKSGNIFLTNEGHCLKLGDFGCAVKIRSNTTAPGELQGFVGTQAYMAPEVFMKTSGHGRAADIWSLGCVVTEMASGKRPFSDYDSNYQIMFVVGMGERPHVPDTLSAEGQEFCRLCLTHAPEERPRAEALSLHHFLMVKSDDACDCRPAYLIT